MAGEADYFLGKIVKTHGIHGEVLLVTKNQLSGVIQKLETVHIEIDGQRVPFFISDINVLSADSVSIKFDAVDSQAQCKLIVGCNVFADKPPRVPDNQTGLNLTDLIGFTLYDQDERNMGIVKDVFVYPENPVLLVHEGDNEILVPANEELILSVNPSDKEIRLVIPHGLPDIYY